MSSVIQTPPVANSDTYKSERPSDDLDEQPEPDTTDTEEPTDAAPQSVKNSFLNKDQAEGEYSVANLCKKVFARGTVFYRNQMNTTYAWVPADPPAEHWEFLAIKSQRFRARFLKFVIQDYQGHLPSPQAIRRCFEIFITSAEIDEEPITTHNRTAFEDGNIYIDLADEQWRSVKINEQGWNFIEPDAPRFVRFAHQLPLCPADSGGDPNALFRFLPNIDKESKLLILAWILAALHPEIPSPILVIVGPQGSAKTTISSRLRSLVDPSKAALLGELELGQLTQIFSHHAVPCFENVSKFNRKTSDAFCRAVTGTAVERRKYFTDSDSVLFAHKRAIIINGISLPSVRPDFLDRCLVIQCQRLEEFMSLQELDRDFQQQMPALLGGLYDLMSKVLGNLKQVPTTSKFRLSDFARFGRAMAVAQGQALEDFDRAYSHNIVSQDIEIIEDCATAQLIKQIANEHTDQNPIETTAQKLLKTLRQHARQNDLNALGKQLPGSARWLSTRLQEIKPVLERDGVIVERMPRSNHERPWKIYTLPRQQEEEASELTPEQRQIQEITNQGGQHHAH